MTAVQARAYADKAAEFARAAATECEERRYIAATSLAVHAGINAADAVCGARLGRRSAGDDHDQALILLDDAGRDGAEIKRELAKLLPLKSRAEYDPSDVAAATARRASERAARCAAIARRVTSPTR